jgi:serine/threonine protein kinase
MMLTSSGYMSPEYALEGVFSVKSDVYTFGVLILEIVSGSKISSVQVPGDFANLIAFVSTTEHSNMLKLIVIMYLDADNM